MRTLRSPVYLFLGAGLLAGFWIVPLAPSAFFNEALVVKWLAATLLALPLAVFLFGCLDVLRDFALDLDENGLRVLGKAFRCLWAPAVGVSLLIAVPTYLGGVVERNDACVSSQREHDWLIDRDRPPDPMTEVRLAACSDLTYRAGLDREILGRVFHRSVFYPFYIVLRILSLMGPGFNGFGSPFL